MKKLFSLFFPALAALILLTACTPAEAKTPANYINYLEPTAEQQELIDLISPDTEFLFFEYKTEEAFNEMEFWVEVYNHGELIDSTAGVSTFTDGDEAQSGKLSVMIMKESGYQWAFSVTDGKGGKYSYTSDPFIFDYSEMARGSTYINDPVAIEDGKEIALYAAQFTSGSTLRAFDADFYIDNPEYLNSSDYVHLIKCKFTK